MIRVAGYSVLEDIQSCLNFEIRTRRLLFQLSDVSYLRRESRDLDIIDDRRMHLLIARPRGACKTKTKIATRDKFIAILLKNCGVIGFGFICHQDNCEDNPKRDPLEGPLRNINGSLDSV